MAHKVILRKSFLQKIFMRKLANIKPNVRMHEKLLMDYHKLWLSTCIESNWAMFFSSAYVCDGRSLNTWGIHCQRNEIFNPLSSSGNPSTSFSLQAKGISKLILIRVEVIREHRGGGQGPGKSRKGHAKEQRRPQHPSTPGHGSVWVNIYDSMIGVARSSWLRGSSILRTQQRCVQLCIFWCC